MLAVLDADAQRDFRLNWSRWRRVHQAVAARCRAVRQARKQVSVSPVRADAPATTTATLTDAAWERICPLLPAQRPRTGRPRHDHRTVLTGILSVVRTGGSWREIPDACGKWETAYKRYRLWQDTGLWKQILAVLEDEEREVSL